MPAGDHSVDIQISRYCERMASTRNKCASMCPQPTLRQDKGFAWFILFMSFLSHAVHLGFTWAVIGNLTVIHQSLFHIDLQLSTFIGSVHVGVLFLFAPFASILVKKLKCRLTQIIGGICLVLGVGLSYFSTQPWQAFLLFGLLGGMGVSSLYVACSEVLALNFTKYKYLAFSIAVLGYYGGVVAFPIVSQKLFDQVGYNKAMAIMSSFHLMHIIAGFAFYQPPEGQVEPIEDNNNLSEEKFTDGISGKKHSKTSKTEEHPLPIFKTSVPEQNLPPEKQIQHNIEEPSISSDGEQSAAQTETTSLKDDFKILLTSPKIWALLFNGLLWNLNVAAFLILVTDFALEKAGVNKDEAAFGVTVIGIANIAGCLLVISVSALTFDRLILHFTCTMTYGIATIILAFSKDKTMFYTMAAIWGLSQGASIANLLGVLDNFCDVKQLALLFGLYLFAEGFGALGGPPLCGYVSEQLGAEYGVILAGSTGVAGSLCVVPILIQRLMARLRGGSTTEYNITKENGDEQT